MSGWFWLEVVRDGDARRVFVHDRRGVVAGGACRTEDYPLVFRELWRGVD